MKAGPGNFPLQGVVFVISILGAVLSALTR